MGTGTQVSTGDLIEATHVNRKLQTVANADVDSDAGIVESKLSLDYATSTLNTSISAKSDALATETLDGSDCSGSDGEADRTLQLSATPSQIIIIAVGGAIQYVTTDYTLATDTITFINKVWDDQKIQVSYVT